MKYQIENSYIVFARRGGGGGGRGDTGQGQLPIVEYHFHVSFQNPWREGKLSLARGGNPWAFYPFKGVTIVTVDRYRENRGDGGEEETVLNSFGFLDDEDSDEDENEDEDEDEGVYPQDTTSVSQLKDTLATVPYCIV